MQPALSIPAAGRTIQRALTPWANPLFDSFTRLKKQTPAELQHDVANVFRRAYALPNVSHGRIDVREEFDLACAAALSLLLVARTALHSASLSFLEAEEWFLGEDPGRRAGFSGLGWPPQTALEPLNHLAYGQDVEDALPYIMEVFNTGPTGASRAADESSRNDRNEKRRFGTFYTPSDVADFIVEQCLNAWHCEPSMDDPGPPCILDPACGTGVFLLSAFKQLTDRLGIPARMSDLAGLSTAALFGADISAQAVQASSFTLLSRCVVQAQDRECGAVVGIWREILHNHVVLDATQLHKGLDDSLSSPQLNFLEPHDTAVASTLGVAFPTLRKGADILLGNPPYSTDAGPMPRGAAYLPFLRMMWRLTRDDRSAAGMVVPLSLGYHSGSAFVRIRQQMATIQGVWKVAFFDRTPDSLFGDDVKTRNCIALLSKGRAVRPALHTSSFLRWNSRERSSLFSRLTFAKSDWSLAKGVLPKLGSPLEFECYKALRRADIPVLQSFITTKPPGTVADSMPPSCMAFGVTAYNWLPVFRSFPDALEGSAGAPSSHRSLTTLECSSEDHADLVFALGASRLAYWLWRVEGDGFHLPQSFILGLPAPFPSLALSQNTELRALAQVLWRDMLLSPVVSVNKGVRSVSFSPAQGGKTQDAIDEIIAKAFDLPPTFPRFLKRFVRRTIVAGRTATRRERVN